jgi:hypothetical protein
MRILLVNAYSLNTSGRKSFETFSNAIKKCFKLLPNRPPEMRFLTADINTIDEYLYIINTPFNKPEAEVAFNLLDFVFVDGEVNSLPWLKKYRKFKMFMTMCLHTKKVMLAS